MRYRPVVRSRVVRVSSLVSEAPRFVAFRLLRLGAFSTASRLAPSPRPPRCVPAGSRPAPPPSRATATASGESANREHRADRLRDASPIRRDALRADVGTEKPPGSGSGRGRRRRRAGQRAHAREERVAQVRLNPKPAVFVATRIGARVGARRLPHAHTPSPRRSARACRAASGAFGPEPNGVLRWSNLLSSSGVARERSVNAATRTPLAASRRTYVRFSSATGTHGDSVAVARFASDVAFAKPGPGAPRLRVDERLGVRDACLHRQQRARSPLLWFRTRSVNPPRRRRPPETPTGLWARRPASRARRAQSPPRSRTPRRNAPKRRRRCSHTRRLAKRHRPPGHAPSPAAGAWVSARGWRARARRA